MRRMRKRRVAWFLRELCTPPTTRMIGTEISIAKMMEVIAKMRTEMTTAVGLSRMTRPSLREMSTLSTKTNRKESGNILKNMGLLTRNRVNFIIMKVE